MLATDRKDIFHVQTDGKIRFASNLSNRYDVEQVLAHAANGDLSPADVKLVADTYDRLLCHKEFTGRSGTMFAYEGLGCIYWHMVAKLLLAVQEAVFAASDQNSPATGELKNLYRDVRAGLGYKKTPAEYGAFPFDPYSHTPGEGGAQQPGMTGQVKEEILTRWGELGLRWKAGVLFVDPALVDPEEIPLDAALAVTYRRIPFSYQRQPVRGVRVKTSRGWESCPDGRLPEIDVLAVEVGV